MAKSHTSNRASDVSTLKAFNADTPAALFDVCDLAIFYRFYCSNFTEYIVNIMGSIRCTFYIPEFCDHVDLRMA